MRILVTYGRRPPYPLFGVHLVEAFRAAGHAAMLLDVRDRPWWGALAKRALPGWRAWQWDPFAWAQARLLTAFRIAIAYFKKSKGVGLAMGVEKHRLQHPGQK